MNDVNNVALGKPRTGAGIYRAPLGTALPADASSQLGPGFVAQGYVSDEGVSREISRAYAAQKAWGGDEVANSRTEETIRLNFALIEVNNRDALESAFGSEAISGADGLTTVTYKGKETPNSTWVVDMEYKGGLRRIVFPHAANVTEDFSQSFTDESLITLPFSLAAYKDAEGAYFYDHTQGSAAPVPPDSSSL